MGASVFNAVASVFVGDFVGSVGAVVGDWVPAFVVAVGALVGDRVGNVGFFVGRLVGGFVGPVWQLASALKYDEPHRGPHVPANILFEFETLFT